MSLHSRSQKIHKVSQAETTRLVHTYTPQDAKVAGYVKKEVYHVESETHDKPYQVQLKWRKTPTGWAVEGILVSHLEENPHPANNCKTICYQVLGVLKKKATEAGKEIHFSHTLENAKKNGGQVMRVINPSGGGEWTSYRDKPEAVKYNNNRLDYIAQMEGRTISEGGLTHVVKDASFTNSFGMKINLVNYSTAELERLLRKSKMAERVNILRGSEEKFID